MLVARKLAAAILGLGLMAASSVASAITLSFGDAYYLGEFRPGQPAGDATEAAFINLLNDLAAGQGDTACTVVQNGPDDERLCNRLSSALAGPFPDATYAGRFQGNNAPLPGAYQYVLGKYGNVASWVWFNPNGFNGTVTLPGDYPGNGDALSHISYFNRTGGGGGNPMPEPGTLALLGLGLMGLGFARRKA